MGNSLGENKGRSAGGERGAHLEGLGTRASSSVARGARVFAVLWLTGLDPGDVVGGALLFAFPVGVIVLACAVGCFFDSLLGAAVG